MSDLKERIARVKAKANPPMIEAILKIFKAQFQTQMYTALFDIVKDWLLEKEMRSIHVVHREGQKLIFSFLNRMGL